MNLTQISEFTKSCEGNYTIENGALKCTATNEQDLKAKMQKAWDFITLNDLSVVVLRNSLLSFTIRFHVSCPIILN